MKITDEQLLAAHELAEQLAAKIDEEVAKLYANNKDEETVDLAIGLFFSHGLQILAYHRGVQPNAYGHFVHTWQRINFQRAALVEQQAKAQQSPTKA